MEMFTILIINTAAVQYSMFTITVIKKYEVTKAIRNS